MESNHFHLQCRMVQKEVTSSYFDDVKAGRLPEIRNVTRHINDKLQLELSIHRRTMALFPDVEFAKRHEPYLANAIRSLPTLESAQGREVIKFHKHVAKKWKVNPTWYAEDFERSQPHIGAIKPTIENIRCDFFFLCCPDQFPDDATTFYDCMRSFFERTAAAFKVTQPF